MRRRQGLNGFEHGSFVLLKLAHWDPSRNSSALAALTGCGFPGPSSKSLSHHPSHENLYLQMLGTEPKHVLYYSTHDHLISIWEGLSLSIVDSPQTVNMGEVFHITDLQKLQFAVIWVKTHAS